MKKTIFTILLTTLVFAGIAYSEGLKGLGFVAPTINDRAEVYGPETGEILYDYESEEFYGRKHDSTWVSLSSSTTSSVPAGTILPYVGTVAPVGFALCDGATVSRTTYATLYSVIGTAFGEGDGSTTFHLPDLRGKFLRGVDGSAGNDPDDSTRVACNTGGNTGDNIGSCQQDEYKEHDHGGNLEFREASSAMTVSGSTREVSSGSSKVAAISGSSYSDIRTVRSQANGGNETRPKNVYINYIIKL